VRGAPNKAFEQTRRSSAQGRGVSARCSTPRRWADRGPMVLMELALLRLVDTRN